MDVHVREMEGQRFLEGTPGQALMERAADVTGLLEACFGHAVDRLLLYSENLPANFFDLSSGDAGAVLQKLRAYHIRLAVVGSPTLRVSSRFSELLVDEQRGPDFRLFDTPAAAHGWLCSR